MRRWSALVLTLTASVAAEELPKGPRLSNVPYELRSVDLPSGARFVLEQDRSRPLVMVAAVVDVGAADDPAGQEGLAHLVEHLAFRTRTDGKHPHTDLLELLGAGAWNAFTTHDVTVYYTGAAAPALTELLKVETARLLDPLKGVDQQTFDVEREVVRNELRQRNERGEVAAVETALAAALYPPSHPYSRPIIGTDASLQTLTLDGARAFAAKHYRPEKMTLLVAGQVDPEGIPALLEKGMATPFLAPPPGGPIKPATRLVAKPPPPPDMPNGPVLRTIKAAAPVPTLHIAWSLPRGLDDKDAHLQTFAARALPGAVAGAFRDEQILDIGGSLQRGKLGSTLVLDVVLAEGKDPARAMEQVLDKLIELWFTRNAARFADPSSVGPFERRLQVGMGQTITSEALASESLLERNIQRVQTAHLTGDISYIGREMQSLAKMGAGDLSAFAFEWLARTRARAVFVQPDGSVQGEGGPAAVFASVSAMKLTVPAEVFAKRVTGPSAIIRTVRLPNGLEVVVARRASGPVVAVTLAARGGEADAEPLGAAELAAYAGVRDGRHGLVQTVGMREYQWSGASTSYLAYQGASGNLTNALGRMFDVVDTSRVGTGTDAVLALWNRQRAERIFNLPAERAARQLRAALHAGTPLARTPSPADVAKVGPGDANGWLERTWTPANSVLTIVGDVDPDFAIAAAGSFLGDWKRKAPALLPPQTGAGRSPDQPVPQVATERSDAQQTTLRLACVVPVKTAAGLAAARVLAERLETRMHQAARLALGATYGFASDVRLSRGLARLDVAGAIEERALARVAALMKRDAEALGKEPLSEDDLGRIRWREGITSSFRYGRSFELSRALADLRLSGLPEDTLERYPATLSALTAEAVTAAGAACRATAVIQVVGPPAVVQRMGGPH